MPNEPVKRYVLTGHGALLATAVAPKGWQQYIKAGDFDRLARELAALQRGCDESMRRDVEIEQALGKALGYPWYKDDQKNFPGATEADGVCVGEHLAFSIAAEAAARIIALECELAAYKQAVREISAQVGNQLPCVIEFDMSERVAELMRENING